MSSLDRFPVKLADIGACPERFQASLRNAVDQSETINTLIYCPPYPSGRTSLPGSVLCLTDRQWVIVHDAKRSRPPIVKQALYDDTLFVELKIVLLYGCLKIHFAKGDRSESAECYFNTVMEQMFSGVIETIHNRIDQLKFAPKEKDAGIRKHWEGWSFKFQNYCQDYLPPGKPAFSIVVLANRIRPFSTGTRSGWSFSSDRSASYEHRRAQVVVLVPRKGRNEIWRDLHLLPA
jgi:hypothetical protein